MPPSACRNPLACARARRAYAQNPDFLFAAAAHAVRTLERWDFGAPESVETTGDRRLRATFRVYLFRDVLDLSVEEGGGGSVLHVRSRSAVPFGWDAGVNGRRLRALLAALDGA
jgi:uncharacterized protein (DUF1499 family)